MVRDASGRVLRSEAMAGKQGLTLDISEMDPGIYLVDLLTADGTSHTRRFVKE